MIFDVLIVGETTTAMLSAALLAKKGLQVAWVVSPFHGMNSEKKVVNPVVPDLVWELLPPKLVNEVMFRLGVPTKHLEKSERKEAGIQFVCPEFRTIPVNGLLSFRKEIQRIFGPKSAELEKILKPQVAEEREGFLYRYWPALFRETTRTKAQAFSFLTIPEGIESTPLKLERVRNAGLRRLFELIIYSQTYLSGEFFPKSLQEHFIQNFLNLNIFARGGLVSPDRIVQEVFRMAGGTLFVEEEKAFLESHQRKGISLWLKNEKVVNGSVCLVSVEPNVAHRMCEEAHIPKKWLTSEKDSAGSVKMASIVFTVPPLGIPAGMGEHVIIYLGDASSPFNVAELVFLSFNKGRPGVEMEGIMTVFYKEDPPENKQNTWAKNKLKRLEGLFPYMPSRLQIKSLSFPTVHPLFPETYYYGTTKKRRLGTTMLKANNLGENFYFTGRRQLDYLGLEGEILTSLAASDWAMQQLAKL